MLKRKPTTINRAGAEKDSRLFSLEDGRLKRPRPKVWCVALLIGLGFIFLTTVQRISIDAIVDSDRFRWLVGGLELHKLLPLTPEYVMQDWGLDAVNAEFCTAKARFGNPGDGGWNVCLDPPLLKKKTEEVSEWSKLGRRHWPPADSQCVVYSFGSNYDFSFEYSISRLHCEVHSFDPTMMTFNANPLTNLTGIHFHHWALGPSKSFASSSKTLDEIMKELGHTTIEVLKMDVEGDEWNALEHMFATGILKNVRQIVWELHLRNANIDQVRKVFSAFAENGFGLWSRNDNWKHSYIIPFGGHYIFHAMEFSMIKR